MCHIRKAHLTGPSSELGQGYPRRHRHIERFNRGTFRRESWNLDAVAHNSGNFIRNAVTLVPHNHYPPGSQGGGINVLTIEKCAVNGNPVLFASIRTARKSQ